MNRRLISLLALVATPVIFGGCEYLTPTVSKTPTPAAYLATPAPSLPLTPASLWRDEGDWARMYTDNRAIRVGDIVSIKIIEDAKGSKSATTKTSKDSSFENTFKGTIASFFGISEQAKQFASPDATLKVTGKDKYDGSGATTRSDQLTASMTAVVTDVLPNGNLKIQGSREVVINSERQTMTVSGIIRPIDVDSKNTVLSTAVADAKITYTGFGVVDDKQHPGWLVRVLNWISPF
jgi:flagellar L-ring protein precursor FlgH